jgi:hypothetical protein
MMKIKIKFSDFRFTHGTIKFLNCVAGVTLEQ